MRTHRKIFSTERAGPYGDGEQTDLRFLAEKRLPTTAGPRHRAVINPIAEKVPREKNSNDPFSFPPLAMSLEAWNWLRSHEHGGGRGFHSWARGSGPAQVQRSAAPK